MGGKKGKGGRKKREKKKKRKGNHRYYGLTADGWASSPSALSARPPFQIPTLHLSINCISTASQPADSEGNNGSWFIPREPEERSPGKLLGRAVAACYLPAQPGFWAQWASWCNWEITSEKRLKCEFSASFLSCHFGWSNLSGWLDVIQYAHQLV